MLIVVLIVLVALAALIERKSKNDSLLVLTYTCIVATVVFILLCTIKLANNHNIKERINILETELQTHYEEGMINDLVSEYFILATEPDENGNLPSTDVVTSKLGDFYNTYLQYLFATKQELNKLKTTRESLRIYEFLLYFDSPSPTPTPNNSVGEEEW